MAPDVSVRDDILDAAESLMSRLGYRKMTIDDIARDAGIGKGTIYLHFTSKEEVTLETIGRIVDRVVERLEEIASLEKPAVDRLKDMLVERVMMRFDAVLHYSQNLNDMLATIRPALLERRKKWFDREAEVFARVLAESTLPARIGSIGPKRVARSFIAATNSFLPLSLSARELGGRAKFKAELDDVVELLILGLR